MATGPGASVVAIHYPFRQRGARLAPRGATETFRSELEAKEFARQKLADTQNITAGTLNPHSPKRLIPPAQLIEWLEEPHDTDAAP
jgi:hypothetical protein